MAMAIRTTIEGLRDDLAGDAASSAGILGRRCDTSLRKCTHGLERKESSSGLKDWRGLALMFYTHRQAGRFEEAAAAGHCCLHHWQTDRPPVFWKYGDMNL